VYDALGMTRLFSIGPREAEPRCLLEQAVNRAVGEALGDAEAVFMKRMRSITLQEVLAAAPRERRRKK
jgi:hypothetical protein